MTSRRILYFLAFLLLLGSSACTRCLKCTEYNAAGTPIYEYPETCGNKEDIEKLQAQILANEDPGKKAECLMRR